MLLRKTIRSFSKTQPVTLLSQFNVLLEQEDPDKNEKIDLPTKMFVAFVDKI